MAAQNFKLFLGCLGNGVTVCNSAVMEDGDFKMVAHISNEGKITWYVEPRLYPRGFCVLGLEQLHGLLVCCEILLVLFFQRGEPFARSCEVCRFPLELVIICIRPKSPVSLTASGW